MKSGAQMPDAILIAGATASGKTALAVEAARRFNGVVINADSMQVYANLRVVTARPTPQETGGIEHLLFGHVDESEAYSVARWLEDARKALEKVREAGKLPIFAGGTGLYFKALLEGLSPVPPIDPGIREELRERSLTNPDEVFARLAEADSEGLARLAENDLQRAVRALEVVLSSGRTLREWQAQGEVKPLIEAEKVAKFVLEWPRDLLRERIAVRFHRMIEDGALDEISTLLARNLDASLPAMRAIGVPQLASHLRGESGLEEAVEKAITASRQYAKRQQTWFRHQFGPDWERISGQNPEEILDSSHLN